MKGPLLLDTQALLWLRMDSSDLPAKARKAFLKKENELFLSLASVWEMAIKISLKKLQIQNSLSEFVQSAQDRLGITLLPIRLEHLIRVETLPFHHRDPFDRLIVAQALHEHMTILGSDSSLDAYGVNRIWD